MESRYYKSDEYLSLDTATRLKKSYTVVCKLITPKVTDLSKQLCRKIPDQIFLQDKEYGESEIRFRFQKVNSGERSVNDCTTPWSDIYMTWRRAMCLVGRLSHASMLRKSDSIRQ